jgi:hypothetical protein
MRRSMFSLQLNRSRSQASSSAIGPSRSPPPPWQCDEHVGCTARGAENWNLTDIHLHCARDDQVDQEGAFWTLPQRGRTACYLGTGAEACGHFARHPTSLGRSRGEEVAHSQVRKRALELVARGIYLVRPFRTLLRPSTSSSAVLILARARGNGVTEEELVEAITQLAFYSGWPNALTAAGLAREVFGQRGR